MYILLTPYGEIETEAQNTQEAREQLGNITKVLAVYPAYQFEGEEL